MNALGITALCFVLSIVSCGRGNSSKQKAISRIEGHGETYSLQFPDPITNQETPIRLTLEQLGARAIALQGGYVKVSGKLSRLPSGDLILLDPDSNESFKILVGSTIAIPGLEERTEVVARVCFFAHIHDSTIPQPYLRNDPSASAVTIENKLISVEAFLDVREFGVP